MSRTYVQPGHVIPWTNGTGSAVVSGQMIPFGNCVAVAMGDIANGGVGEIALDGVHDVAKISGADIAAGTLPMLDVSATPDAFDAASATPATGDITGGALAIAAAGVGTTTVRVRLLPGSGTVN